MFKEKIVNFTKVVSSRQEEPTTIIITTHYIEEARGADRLIKTHFLIRCFPLRWCWKRSSFGHSTFRQLISYFVAELVSCAMVISWQKTLQTSYSKATLLFLLSKFSSTFVRSSLIFLFMFIVVSYITQAEDFNPTLAITKAVEEEQRTVRS